MGVLFHTHCYCAGNLENCDDEFTWRDYVTNELKPLGIICLDPTKKCFIDFPLESKEDRLKLKEEREKGNCEYVKKYMVDIIGKDLRSVDKSDFIIVNLEEENPTFGTIHEITTAEAQHKPTFLVLRDKKNLPMWLAGLIRDAHIFSSITDCVQYIKDIDAGKITLDTKEWKLLEMDYR